MFHKHPSKTLQIRRTSCLFETNQYKKTDRSFNIANRRILNILKKESRPWEQQQTPWTFLERRWSPFIQIALRQLVSNERVGENLRGYWTKRAQQKGGRGEATFFRAFKGSRILRGVEEFREWPHAPRGRKIFTRSIGILWSSCRQTEARNEARQ